MSPHSLHNCRSELILKYPQRSKFILYEIFFLTINWIFCNFVGIFLQFLWNSSIKTQFFSFFLQFINIRWRLNFSFLACTMRQRLHGNSFMVKYFTGERKGNMMGKVRQQGKISLTINPCTRVEIFYLCKLWSTAFQ